MEFNTETSPGTLPSSLPPSGRVRVRLEIQGIVQGVGFRPFVYRLASALHLNGFVRNHDHGVEVQLEGSAKALQTFLLRFHAELPPLASVDSQRMEALIPLGDSCFRIEGSAVRERRFTLVSPDIGTCPDCALEVRTPGERRYGYPFTNCTNCGPRFTLIEDLPYDRVHTTMRSFPLCPDCAGEYENPADRRFHAEPIACPRCGPTLYLTDPSGALLAEDPLPGAVNRLLAGEVLAIKGLGGFHLACDASSPEAVRRLRSRKRRDDKPFALMAPGMADVHRICLVDAQEAGLLASAARPIVLLKQKAPSPIAPLVAPGSRELGVMLPYTPLHHLLLRKLARPLVMTSGNLTDEPIAHQDEDARKRLSGIADAFLTNDREIHTRCDDSVARIWNGAPRLLRRARGYAPAPIRLEWKFRRHVLACGGELKNTFCLGRDRFAFVSHHIGDLENEITLRAFQQAVAHYQRLFQVEPEVIVHDLHPDYLSTRYALEAEFAAEFEAGGKGVRMGVQHHHAHIASVLAENGMEGPVIGVAYDGTGYGTDGHLWGGEFLVADLRDFHRAGHFTYFPLPGGSQAIRQPWRTALALLLSSYGRETYDLPLALLEGRGESEVPMLERMIERRINSPLSCGVGRLFDAVSALLTGRHIVNYEGQAAIELEQLADPAAEEVFPIDIMEEGEGFLLPSESFLRPVVEGLRRGRPHPVLAAAFHNTLAGATAEVCRRIAKRTGIREVALSGGVFQNVLLLNRLQAALEKSGLTCITHRRVPANDGGISLGQAVIGERRACA